MSKYTVDPNRVVDFSGCQKGIHPFKVIQSMNTGYDTASVVRWCPKCGAVVVDMDFDNRTNPGYHQKIKYPEITLKYGLEMAPINKKYYFTFTDGSFPYCAEDVKDFKEAMIKLIEYTGDNSSLLLKSLNGMTTEIEMVQLYNHFSTYTIELVFEIDKIIYPGETKDE